MEMNQAHKPVITPMPPLPSGSFLNKNQWDMLFAIMDGCLPSITSPSALPPNGNGATNAAKGDDSRISLPDADYEKLLIHASKSLLAPKERAELESFFAYRPAEDSQFRDDCVRTLAISPQKGELGMALSLLATRPGSLLLTGHWTPLTQQPVRVREAIIQSWFRSRLPPLRMLAKNMVTVAQKGYCMTSSLFGEMSGYTDIPENWKATAGYDYKFLQPPPAANADDAYEITTDVVVVGSGCGGGVTAKNLAEAGHKVLVVDKGYYFPPSHLPMPQGPACEYLFDHGGVYLTESGSAGVAAGASWGGGGTVNWSVSLELQDFVRKEWADEGMDLFASKDYDECIKRVSEFAGVGTSAIRHNHRNLMILDGSKKLGWAARDAPQNTANKEHYCGQCHLGCGSAEKRGPAVSWLPAAGEAGAQFMEGFRVEKVLFGPDGKTAIGVEGLWTGRDEDGGVHKPISERVQRKVIIKAKKVVISSGSLWSPLILMKSGIKNRNVGRNLHLHPCNLVTSVHKEDVRPWEGGIITSLTTEFENLDEKGHGVKLEPTCMVPYAILALQPWQSGTDAKLRMLKYRHTNGFIALTRDRDTGRVFPDPHDGSPRIEYDTSNFDRAHSLEGVQAIAKICYVSGATEIRAHLPGLETFVPTDGGRAQAIHPEGKDPEYTDPAFARWLQRLRLIGNKPPVAGWSSAHQMGTCRMSAVEEKGVVNQNGQVWGKEGLYVADASVFPSASGVNPMLTTLSISDWISRKVAEDLAKSG